MKRFAILFVLILISGCTTSNVIYESNVNESVNYEGPFIVTNVVDGDTLDLNNSERIRLSGINTPETGECYYQEAEDKLKELVLNKEVSLEGDRTNKDKYERLLRYVYINDTLVNSVLVEEGYARVYDKYEYDTKRYDELKEVEKIAQENNLGVWSCIDPKENCAYVASNSSNKYHLPDCKWAKKIKPENLICFNSKEDAEKVGYEPCKTCNP